MRARVSTFTAPPDSIEEPLRLIRGQIVPGTREPAGPKAFLGLTDRVAGRTLIVTVAEDAGTLASSDELGTRLGELIAGDLGATVESVDDYEVSAFEAGPAPSLA